MSAVAHGKSAKKVEKRRTEVLESNRTASQKVMKMPGYMGNEILRDSVIAFLNLSYHVLNEDFEKILNLDEIKEQSYDNMEAYLLAQEEASKKLEAAGVNMDKAKDKFCAENDINLGETKSPLEEKMEKAGEAFGYYNKVYLIFFKSYKQEMYLLDAIERSDVNAIEQNRNAIQQYAGEDKLKLKELGGFKSDVTLQIACRKLLDFYENEGKVEMKTILDFFLKTDEFQKIKTAFENKREKDRTQSDFDKYNESANEANKAGAKYNATNEKLFENRSRLINEWNSKMAEFLDRHVP